MEGGTLRGKKNKAVNVKSAALSAIRPALLASCNPADGVNHLGQEFHSTKVYARANVIYAAIHGENNLRCPMPDRQ